MSLSPQAQEKYASGHIEHGDNLHIMELQPIVQPELLRHEIQLSDSSKKTTAIARYQISQVLHGTSDRLVAIVGPCSIHNPDEAVEYAKLLKEVVPQVPNLIVVMRTYFEKPRTTVGWKGLINDPHLDESYDINTGLRIARHLLADITELGMPVGCELLDTISPQYLSDAVAWGAIGARTTESQLHRELASGASFPIGFKNGTDGSLTVAVDAMRSASRPHAFLGISSHGSAAIVRTTGNPDLHVILRGGNNGTNYDSANVKDAVEKVKKVTSPEHPFCPAVMVDASHANSQKDHNKQVDVLKDVANQIRNGEDGIFGVMCESNINEGNQKMSPDGRAGLKKGISITDACLDFERTKNLLLELNEAVQIRRSKK